MPVARRWRQLLADAARLRANDAGLLLDALDDLLIPTTENGELKQLLVEVRPAFAAHLAYAKKIGQNLQASR